MAVPVGIADCRHKPEAASDKRFLLSLCRLEEHFSIIAFCFLGFLQKLSTKNSLGALLSL